MIVTSNEPFHRCGDVFCVAVGAAAMIDGLLRHGDVISLKGDS